MFLLKFVVFTVGMLLAFCFQEIVTGHVSEDVLKTFDVSLKPQKCVQRLKIFGGDIMCQLCLCLLLYDSKIPSEDHQLPFTYAVPVDLSVKC